MSADDDDRQWHLDKKVPLALIFTIGVQTAAAMWWAAGLTTRVEHLERQFTASAPVSERVIRVETKIEAMRDDIAEIKTLLRARRSDANP